MPAGVVRPSWIEASAASARPADMGPRMSVLLKAPKYIRPLPTVAWLSAVLTTGPLNIKAVPHGVLRFDADRLAIWLGLKSSSMTIAPRLLMDETISRGVVVRTFVPVSRR